MKYEKPKLVEIDEVKTTHGACADGSVNIENCGGGSNVIPMCTAGGVPTATGG